MESDDKNGDSAEKDKTESEDKKDDEQKSEFTSVGLKSELADKKTDAAADASEDKKDEDEQSKDANVAIDDDEDDSGDVKAEGEENKKSSPQESQDTKLSKKGGEKVPEEPAKPKLDYDLMDSLCGFLESEETLLPIICGYFLKIMQ